MDIFIETYHDDVIKGKNFPRYWLFVWGIHRSPVNCPHKGQGRRALMFSLICVWTNSWVNNRDAGDLRRHRAHYDVTVMYMAAITVASVQVPYPYCEPIYWHGLTLILTWISNHMPNKVWDEMIYQLSNGFTSAVWEWIRDFLPHFILLIYAGGYIKPC